MFKFSLISFIFLFIVSSAISQSIFVRNDSVIINLTIYIEDYQECQSTLSTQEGYYNPWYPASLCDPRPTILTSDKVKNIPTTHFHILNNEGDCLLVDGRLYDNDQAGLYYLKISIPIGIVINENNIKFDLNSDYVSIDLLSTGLAQNFILERGESYDFRLSEWTDECGGVVSGQRFTAPRVFTIPCCAGIRGNVDGDSLEEVDVSDLVYLVDFIFTEGPPPQCLEEGNVDGDVLETIVISDLVFLVDFMFTDGPPPSSCP